MNLKAIGSRIKAAREKKGLTQEALSEILNLSPMHMSVIERGFKPTKLDTFVRIANALDVSADELLQDVVEHSTESISGELYEMIQELPKHEQQKLLHCIKAYIEACALTSE
ncbi:MAG: helix-turn-helix transcriptional regulator [Bacteroides sp.]|nr:helix-turn-helix transcriptional regulator [Bacteroides sp.]